MLFLSLRSGDLQNSFNRLVILLFVVAFVLLADLLRLAEKAADAALCIVRVLRYLRHTHSDIIP